VQTPRPRLHLEHERRERERDMSGEDRPIGVFDSGVGGLTVLRALRRKLPREHLLYLGDTARVPYGTKSAASVTRYALQAARALVERDIKLLVIACNTASASLSRLLLRTTRPCRSSAWFGRGRSGMSRIEDRAHRRDRDRKHRARRRIPGCDPCAAAVGPNHGACLLVVRRARRGRMDRGTLVEVLRRVI